MGSGDGATLNQQEVSLDYTDRSKAQFISYNNAPALERTWEKAARIKRSYEGGYLPNLC